jgi:hypothetical protein
MINKCYVRYSTFCSIDTRLCVRLFVAQLLYRQQEWCVRLIRAPRKQHVNHSHAVKLRPVKFSSLIGNLINQESYAFARSTECTTWCQYVTYEDYVKLAKRR